MATLREQIQSVAPVHRQFTDCGFCPHKAEHMEQTTKWHIANTLLALTEEMPLDKISVSAIVKKAGIGRQTFYNHFIDKNDLIYWIFLRTLSGEKELMEHIHIL